MATQVPGADNQSSTEQVPQISGPESETSVARHADLNLSVPTPIATYNPYMLMQQLGTAQSYSTYQNQDSQQPQGYVPSSGIHGGSFYTAPQELHHGYPGYHLPVQEQMQGFSELQQQQNYMQQVVQSSQTVFETSRHQGQMQRILPRRLSHMRQRIRRRNRTNRGPISTAISNMHSVAANMVYNNREHSTATSITGSVTSGPVLQTSMELEGSQERLSRLTSATTAIEEASGIGENFECNICFQKANEAVVTCCGHLFCWPCLYRWLHVHSYHKECPVCKGSIAEYSITPIYGRENALASARLQSALGSERIPPRPAARRVESARQQREREQVQTTQEQGQATEIEQVATEIEEGEPQAPTSELQRREDNDNIPESEGAETAASRLQDDMNQLGSEPTESSGGYLQRRLAFRREQLRQALANSRYSAALNQIPGGERQQILTASAVLSQEWEHVINGSRLVVDPTQAAAWLASMHARLANMEGNVEPSFDGAQQRTAVSQPPSQVADWITTMRTRLNNIEQLMHNLERPIEMPQAIATENPTSELDDTDDLNSSEFLAELNATVAQPPEVVAEQNPTLVVAVLQPDGNESGPEVRSIVPETNVVRRARRRREHGEEASHVVAASEEEPHEDQLPLTRKRRRRLD